MEVEVEVKEGAVEVACTGLAPSVFLRWNEWAK